MPASDRPYSSVWARPRRKERSTLTREQIVTQAIQLLDGEGIEALSMRKLAARLDVGATSLYWHVANRDELIELVVDEVYGELDLPDAAVAGTRIDVAEWRAATRRYAHSIRATVLRHPWVVSVVEYLVTSYLGPNLTRVTERLLALFEAAGFEQLREAERAVSILSSYVLGVATAEAAWRNWMARHGQTEQEWMSAAKAVADTTTEGYERVKKVVAEYATFDYADPQKAMDEDFDYGLDVMLDGLQVRLGAK
jgi:AcrR family transcriptional regulator